MTKMIVLINKIMINKKSPFCPKNYENLSKLNGLNIYTFHVGFKKKNDDLLIIVFDYLATVSGVTTLSSIPSAPVIWNQKIFKYGKCKVLLVNSGIANACTGNKGIKAVSENVRCVKNKFNCKSHEVYVSSTGIIGEFLDYKKINNVVNKMLPAKKSKFIEAAKAIMTTDTFPKLAKESLNLSGKKINIFGIAKGSGMIAPNMATMLAYIFIDSPISKFFLDKMLSKSIENTFNSISVDGEMSTSDTVLLFAIQKSKYNKILKLNKKNYQLLEKSVHKVMERLAKQIVMDGEGISKFITVNITSAKTILQAKKIAFAIAESSLVKTAIAGSDPNWGRVIQAVGKSKEKIKVEKLKLKFGKYKVCDKGVRIKKYNEKLIQKYMRSKKIQINLDLGLGKYSKKIWTSDLTKRYVEINSDYRT